MSNAKRRARSRTRHRHWVQRRYSDIWQALGEDGFRVAMDGMFVLARGGVPTHGVGSKQFYRLYTTARRPFEVPFLVKVKP